VIGVIVAACEDEVLLLLLLLLATRSRCSVNDVAEISTQRCGEQSSSSILRDLLLIIRIIIRNFSPRNKPLVVTRCRLVRCHTYTLLLITVDNRAAHYNDFLVVFHYSCIFSVDAHYCSSCTKCPRPPPTAYCTLA